MENVWLLLLLIVGVVIGLPLGIALGAVLLMAAAALSNVENLGFWKACLIVLVETVIVAPLFLGGHFLLDKMGYSLLRLGSASTGDVLVTATAWSLLVVVSALVGVVLYRLLIPTGVLRAVKIWLFRGLLQLLVEGLVGGLALVGLAIWQMFNPPVG